ncbi:serine hydrolase [Citricoccus zhacaiensis]|uniref:Serine hydrolase n=1 Tax=Citricoccus zhacaiensis TaxID=489142 RepID=A0ABQ2M6G1_9MICC|nr:serine hydrolase [Citricoccus zhacaiensis]GGO47438.1 serine hydrolase [Citricoccus zhacaiensis]
MDTSRLGQDRLSAMERRLGLLLRSQPFAVSWCVVPIGGAVPTGGAVATQSLGAGALPIAGGVHAIGDRADTVVPSFSTRKVSILCAVLALARAGRLDLGQRHTITEAHRDGVQAGIMRTLSAGLELTLADCLTQMMCTSDNICTQLVFEAIGAAVGGGAADGEAAREAARGVAGVAAERAALQYVNDYCAWAGMRSTLHREVFPRTGGLAWHHPIDGLTVTTAADQAHLLALIGSGAGEGSAAVSAARIQLRPEDCRRIIGLMQGIYTPRLGAATTRISFAEKNGRGLRSLSQVGLALDAHGAPLAAVAVYAETIPTALPDGVPGRNAVFTAFAEVGRAIEDWAVPVVTA